MIDCIAVGADYLVQRRRYYDQFVSKCLVATCKDNSHPTLLYTTSKYAYYEESDLFIAFVYIFRFTHSKTTADSNRLCRQHFEFLADSHRHAIRLKATHSTQLADHTQMSMWTKTICSNFHQFIYVTKLIPRYFVHTMFPFRNGDQFRKQIKHGLFHLE